jgi:2-dehydropantoate 2-reductase
MRIAVMGTGGVGGYFGARLAQGGHEVAFVARGRHLAAMRERGLRVTSALGDVHLAKPTVGDDPAALGWFDVILFAVKLWDTEAAAEAVKPMLAAGGVVIPFQNGVESIERVGAIVGSRQVMGGVAYIAARIGEPGVIAPCKGSGIEAELVADIRQALWTKFAFLVALSGMTAAARQPIGVIRADPDMRAAFEAAIREACDLARTKGIELGADFVASQMSFADGLPQQMKASMLHDLEAGGRLEAPWLSGAVARMAREAGGAAPVNATLYAAVKPYCAGRVG